MDCQMNREMASIEDNLDQASLLLLELRSKILKHDPLNKISVDNKAIGATRLYIMPSFRLPVVVTILFYNNYLRIDTKTISPEDLEKLNEIARSQSYEEKKTMNVALMKEQFKAIKIQEVSEMVGLAEIPEIFKNFEQFYQKTKKAVSCLQAVLDGVGYRHEIQFQNNFIEASWYNPFKFTDVHQVEILSAYQELFKKNGIPIDP